MKEEKKLNELEKYISQFSFDEILKIEESDRQFFALKNARNHIKNTKWNEKINQNLFLFLILQNSIISYQIAGSGENRREEFAEKISCDFEKNLELFSKWESNVDRWYGFLTTSKYNKRLYNLKKNRLTKFDKFFFEGEYKKLDNYYYNMELLLEKMVNIMWMKSADKTMTFAIKMFGYGARIVFDKFTKYPMDIKIPVDSRITKIWEKFDIEGKDIQDYLQKVSEKYSIPPLHLDSLLWIKLWKEI